jgi:hypothetical protein
MYPLFNLLHADRTEPALAMTDSASLAQLYIYIVITIFLTAYGCVGAVNIAQSATHAQRLVPHRTQLRFGPGGVRLRFPGFQQLTAHFFLLECFADQRWVSFVI